jgi:glycosyltransferase 2 family protein
MHAKRINEVQRSATTARAEPPRRRRLKLLTRLATIVVTIAFTYVALNGIDLTTAWHALGHCDYWWLVPALALFAIGNVARGMRWRSLFAPGRRPRTATTLNAMMIGYLYNNILPARAGEAARVMVLNQRSSSPAVEITGTVVLERLYDVVAVLLIFFVSEPLLPSVSWFSTAAIAAGILAIAIAVAAVVLAVFRERPLHFLLRPLRRLSPISEARIERSVAELTHGLSGLHNARVAFEALAWTAVAWMASIACAYLIMAAFAMHLGIGAAVLVFVVVGLSMILPAPPASVGVYESATLIALKAFGVGHSTALPYAIVLHLMNFVPFIVIGAVLLHHNAKHGTSRATRRTAQATP